MTYNAGIFRRQGGNELVLGTNGRILDEGGLAGGAGHSPAIWSDCPIFQMMVNPALGVYFHDDFHSVCTTGFPYLITGDTGTFLAVPGSMYGEAIATTTAADNKEVEVTSGNNIAGLIKADATHNWWFEARVKLSQIAAEQGVFVGLYQETGVAADIIDDATMAMDVKDYLGFQIIIPDAAAAIWQTVFALSGQHHQVVSATAATGSTSYVKLGMKSILGTVTFYVDGVVLADSTTSAAHDFPLDQVMQLALFIKTGSAAASSITIDWWSAAQLR